MSDVVFALFEQIAICDRNYSLNVAQEYESPLIDLEKEYFNFKNIQSATSLSGAQIPSQLSLISCPDENGKTIHKSANYD